MSGVDAVTRLALVLAALGVACTGRFVAPEPPSPAEIPELERQVALRPGDADAATRLAAAYREADRLDDAVGLLERTLEAHPDDDAAVYYMGLVYEEAGRDSSALALYQRYLDTGSDPGLKAELERRVELVRRKALREAVRHSLAREAELAGTPPYARTLAVFPFPYLGADPELAPLGRALAQMLVTDLSQTDRLRVLERLEVQYLTEEMSLGQSGRVDPATAARGGRILGAERVVQGQIAGSEEQFVLDAAVVLTADSAAEPRTVGSTDPLSRFFDVEKETTLAIYEAAGIQLTPAERERVLQRRTDNLQALLAYGRGLEAQDAGRFAEAGDHFSRAVSLDPAFGLAGAALAESSVLASAAAMGLDRLASLGFDRLVGSSEYADWLRRQVEFLDIESLLPGPAERDAVSEFIGQEGLSPSSAVLEIILTRPGGSP